MLGILTRVPSCPQMCWTLKLVGGGWWVVVGRVFAGLGSDISWAAAPLMAKEVSIIHSRGSFLSLYCFMGITGFLTELTQDSNMKEVMGWPLPRIGWNSLDKHKCNPWLHV